MTTKPAAAQDPAPSAGEMQARVFVPIVFTAPPTSSVGEPPAPAGE